MNLHKVQSTGSSRFVGTVTLIESKEIKHSLNSRYYKAGLYFFLLISLKWTGKTPLVL